MHVAEGEERAIDLDRKVDFCTCTDLRRVKVPAAAVREVGWPARRSVAECADDGFDGQAQVLTDRHRISLNADLVMLPLAHFVPNHAAIGPDELETDFVEVDLENFDNERPAGARAFNV